MNTQRRGSPARVPFPRPPSGIVWENTSKRIGEAEIAAEIIRARTGLGEARTERAGGPAGLRRYVQRTAAAVFRQARFQLADDRGRCERGGKIVPALAPPFPWSGGKRRLARRIVGLLPPDAAHAGPFAGSLAVVRAQPPAGAETVNDVDGAVVEVWCTLRNRLGTLRQSHPASNSHGSCHPFGRFEGDNRSGIERHQNRNPDPRRQHTRLSRPLGLNDKEEPTLRLGRRRDGALSPAPPPERGH